VVVGATGRCVEIGNCAIIFLAADQEEKAAVEKRAGIIAPQRKRLVEIGERLIVMAEAPLAAAAGGMDISLSWIARDGPVEQRNRLRTFARESHLRAPACDSFSGMVLPEIGDAPLRSREHQPDSCSGCDD